MKDADQDTPGLQNTAPREQQVQGEELAVGASAGGIAAGLQASQVSVLEAEKHDLRDKLLRSLADMENLRRRTERDVADARAYAVSSFARDLLGVADNLRRALESLGPGGHEALDSATRLMVEGVELTERELIKTLDKHGVKKVEPLGQKFDPNLHQAMFEAPDPSQPKGHVVTVVQSGYAINGRVLRPALVGVSSGSAKMDEPPPAA